MRLKFTKKIILVILGLTLALITLEGVLHLSKLIVTSTQAINNRKALKKQSTYRILCLGESTTANQYPPFLEKYLNYNNKNIKFSVIDKGIPGTNTSVILGQLESNLDKYNPDMVITMLGVNDPNIIIWNESNSKITNFLKSLKSYKLIQIIWKNIICKNKLKKKFEQNINKTLIDNSKVLSIRSDQNSIQKNNKFFKLNSDADYQLCIALGSYYKDRGDLFKAKKAFEKAIEINPNNVEGYLQLTKTQTTSCQQQEKLLKKLIKLHPENDNIYYKLGRLYHEQAKLIQAEKAFKKAIEINPNNSWAYLGLGLNYEQQDKPYQAKKAFEKAIEIDPNNSRAYVGLSYFYEDQDDIGQAKKTFEKAIEINPNNSWAYVGLAYLYEGQPNIDQAKKTFEKAIEINPNDSRAYGGLCLLCQRINDFTCVNKYCNKLSELRSKFYNLTTVHNYHKIKKILDKKQIKLVVVQYPLRSIKPLRNIFKKNDNNIIFVDNEKIFNKAISSSYQEYFVDMFAGDFGHCTDKGNKLLAENIGKIILEKIFNK